MIEYDLVILTDKKHLQPDNNDLVQQNAFLEDGLLQNQLMSKGLKVKRVAWNDPLFDWASTKKILFRSTWDYMHHFTEFYNWLELVKTKTKLINSEKLIFWNLDKHYLKELKEKGVLICESIFIEKNESASLSTLVEQNNLDEFVLKPCISAGGKHTYRIKKKDIPKYSDLFAELIQEEAYLLQPFQFNILNKGEISLVYIDGKYTHAVLKRVKKGDFRVQDDFGGSITEHKASKKQIAFGNEVLDACPEMPVYARIDLIWDNERNLALSEIELIEPELWFRNKPNVAKLMADAILKIK